MHKAGEESRLDAIGIGEAETPRPTVVGRLEHAASGAAFARVEVRLTGSAAGARTRGRTVIGKAMTDASGGFSIFASEERDAAVMACQLACDPAMQVYCEAFDFDGEVIAKSGPLNQAALRESVLIRVEKSKPASRAQLKTLSEYMVASRRARVSELAEDLSRPALDSPTRLFPVPVRAGLIEALSKGLGKDLGSEEKPAIELSANQRFINPLAVAGGKFTLEPVGIRTRPGIVNPIEVESPIFGGFGWIQSDDVSYRDYLRGVFVLYGHQQVLLKDGNVSQWTAVLERQLGVRFFQNFRTTDRNSTPVNKLLIPILKKILVAPTGSGFGFALPASSIPAQATLPDRTYLDALLALTNLKIPELENRYRLPLRELDSSISSPVLLNVYTLKRVLSDTAQGPVEPRANVISPPIPGQQGKPILWDSIVGSAPFFLRYEEWLDKQKPFYPENLFSLRTQIQGYLCGGPWLDKPTSDFLKNQEAIPAVQTSMTPFTPYFDSVDEVRRSATFLLAFGAADAKLFEFIVAYDRSEFPKALRLLKEADALLELAKPKEKPGENWLPVETPNTSFPRSMSFVRRRKVAVTNITQLSGEVRNGPKGLELFLQVPRMGYSPGWDYWSTIRQFAESRGLAARLVKYQRAFLIPMFRGMVLTAVGDYASALGQFGACSGAYVGYAKLTTPAGAVYDSLFDWTRAVYHEGSLPYTARVTWDGDSLADQLPFSTLGDTSGMGPSELGPTDLHPVEEDFVRLLQADVMLKWADLLYRTDAPSSLERARELYKGVIYFYGEDPGTAAYARRILLAFPFVPEVSNPLRKGHLERARLGLLQLDAGLNYYGYRDDMVPTLRYRTLRDAANRWAGASKAAQSDFLAYITRLEQLDLDVLAARAQQNKARAQTQIAAEQVEISKAGIAVAQRLVKDVEARIEEKRKEIEDHNSLIGQFSDYFKGMKDTVSSIVDVGKGAKEGATTLGVVSEEEIKVAMKQLGSEAVSGVGVGGGVAVLGAFGAFTALSVVTLQGMADAAMKRDGELAALRNEALPAAHTLVRVQERQVSIALLQASIAATELSYTTDLLVYHGERFLNRDFWMSLSEVASRVMRRQLDLAAQAAWWAERALAYEIARPIRIVRLDYFDARLRDVTGVDRLMGDLSELEAVRLAWTRLSVPIRRTYSLARDLPLAYGALKRSGRCSFAISDDDLSVAHPGTFAHRVRAVTVSVEAPGAAVTPRGMLTNRGLSFVRRSDGGPSFPLVRFEDALPVTEFRLRDDMDVYDMPGEQLMSFEGSGFSTAWELEFPAEANPEGVSRLADVLVTFDIRSSYTGRASKPAVAGKASRSLFASALSLDTAGLGALRAAVGGGKVQFRLDQVALPGARQSPKITNAALLLAGIETGTLKAKVTLASGATASFSIVKGLAMSNRLHFSDGIAGSTHPLNALANQSPAQTVEVEIQRVGAASPPPEDIRDVVLWLEYEHLT